jgi:uncharacterized lipoprotein YajG
MKNLFLIFVLSILSTACAFNPQTVSLDPSISVRKDNLGQGKEIYLSISDDRSSVSLGRRGAGYGPAAEITTEKPLEEVVRSKISDGLKSRGFIVSNNDSLPLQLKIEIRELAYSTSQGFWTGGVHINGALKGLGKNGSESYEEMYRYNKEERVVVVPTAETNAEWINTALTETLNKLLNDEQLFLLLAAKD